MTASPQRLGVGRHLLGHVSMHCMSASGNAVSVICHSRYRDRVVYQLGKSLKIATGI